MITLRICAPLSSVRWGYRRYRSFILIDWLRIKIFMNDSKLELLSINSYSRWRLRWLPEYCHTNFFVIHHFNFFEMVYSLNECRPLPDNYWASIAIQDGVKDGCRSIVILIFFVIPFQLFWKVYSLNACRPLPDNFEEYLTPWDKIIIYNNVFIISGDKLVHVQWYRDATIIDKLICVSVIQDGHQHEGRFSWLFIFVDFN